MLEASQQIRLASTPAFAVGSLRFEPATRQLLAGGERVTLEPRVMQVIALLASAKGQVVGRDEMIDRCWDGRVVGEQSINRVIAIIRKIGAAHPGAFTLETIARVGYLLKCAGEPPIGQLSADQPAIQPLGRPAAMPLDARFTRRAALVAGVGGGLAAVGAVGAVGWPSPQPASPTPPEAKAYIARGYNELDQQVGGFRQQAIAHFRRATELAPESSEAWAALAVGYSFANSFSDMAALQSSLAWTRSSAQRALALDPRNVDAAAAMVIVRPCFRRWVEYEASCRDFLRKAPDQPEVLLGLAGCLVNVGRWDGGIAVLERLVAVRPEAFTPQFRMSHALWQAERLPEAEASLEELNERWPAHAAAQALRLNFYALNGQLTEAQRVAETMRGDGRGEMVMTTDLALDVGRAITTSDDDFRSEVLARVRRVYADGGLFQGSAIAYYDGLNATDDAFEILSEYYFGGSAPWHANFNPQWAPVRGTYLFMGEQTAAIRDDPRFALATRALGLDDYWRRTASRPDYRA